MNDDDENSIFILRSKFATKKHVQISKTLFYITYQM